MTKAQRAFNDVLKEKSKITARLIEIRLMPDDADHRRTEGRANRIDSKARRSRGALPSGA